MCKCHYILLMFYNVGKTCTLDISSHFSYGKHIFLPTFSFEIAQSQFDSKCGCVISPLVRLNGTASRDPERTIMMSIKCFMSGRAKPERIHPPVKDWTKGNPVPC